MGIITREQKHYDDFTRSFFEMEKKFHLFSIRDDNDYPIWDIVRYSVFIELRNISFNRISAKKSIKTINIKKLVNKNYFLKISSLFKIFLCVNENVFFLTSRNRDNKGYFYDVVADDALRLFNMNNITIIESFNNNIAPKEIYKYQEYSVLNFSLFNHFIKVFFKIRPLENSIVEKINYAIQDSFSTNKSFYGIITNEYIRFRRSFQLYNLFFKWNKSKVKRLFVVQNGIQKGLFMAAKNNGIKTFELQHGIIDSSHIAYSYNPEIKYKKDDIIQPEVLFTFSEFWNTVLFNPLIRFIACGNTYFGKKVIQQNNTEYLLVISSVIHNNILSEFVFQIAYRNQNLKIYFKLHPNEFIYKEKSVRFFQNLPNVTVISNEFNVKQLLSKSRALLTIESTAVFEALHNNIKVIVLKKMNYFILNFIFDNPNLYLINNIEEFSHAFNSSFKKTVQGNQEFYKPLEKKLFLSYI